MPYSIFSGAYPALVQHAFWRCISTYGRSDELGLAWDPHLVQSARSISYHSQTRVHEEQPVRHLYMLASANRVAELVLCIVPAYEVLHDTSTFENTNLFSVHIFISNGRNAAIRVDLKEGWLLLLVLRQLQGRYFVWQAELFEQNRDLDAIGRLGSVQVDVRGRGHD